MDTTLSSRAGQLLDGRYRLEAQLARGGMATVYLATDTRLDRRVAVKIAHPELASDPQFVRRFIGEARSAARLASPHVVAVHDQGSDGPVHFIVLEYVPGRSLRELLTERGRLEPDEALDIIEGVLAGLAVAHQAGIAHRDVKPENVLLTNSGGVKVADFGLARAVAGTEHTKTGVIIGTAAYLAPEQVSAGRSDARTDVYAAGVMLFELLTGRQPHTGDTPLAVAYKHVEETVPPPSSLVPGLPPALDALVAMATSRDPDLRPADAGHYLAAIAAVRHDGRGGPRHRDASQADTWPPGGHWQVPPVPVPGPDADPAAGGPGGLAVLGLGPGGEHSGWGQEGQPGWAAPGQLGTDGADRMNHTLVVAAGDADPGYGQPADRGRDRPGRSREPLLQRWLFSRRLAYLLLMVGLVLIAGLGIWWVINGQYSTVPSVRGLTTAAARTELVNSGYQVHDGAGRHANAPRGQVIATLPAGGSRARRGSTVTIVPSLGPVQVTVPPVTGQSLAGAESALRNAGLRPVVAPAAVSATIPAGVVISTQPVAGTRWPVTRPVRITASAGPPLPDFVGQQVQVAQAAAQAGGYFINQVKDARGSQPAGTIVRQSPAAGTAISPHEVVTVRISPGPPIKAIPDVQGMPEGRAEQVLSRAGFKVTVNQGFFGHRVTSYSPTGQAPAGSTITITIGFRL
ncbi:MAG: protein kinase domain-containing protein [Streptosporangiaceae bacterium]